jgi:hypothetical protein
VTTVAFPLQADYTPSHRMIAAATRLRDAWKVPFLDIVEMHDAALGLIFAAGTKDLASALDVLHDVKSWHVDRLN